MHPPEKTFVVRTVEVFVCIVLAAGGVVQAQSNQSAACPGPGFNPRPWLEDFAQLTAEMSAHYSNLEFAIRDRHMDLPAVRAETEAKLGRSCDEHEARRVLELFLKSFGDGHLEMRWPQTTAPQPEARQNEPSSLCARLDYKKPNLKPGVDFSQLPQFSRIGGEEADWFPGGILRVTDTAKVGVIRIALFSEHAFPDVCQQAIQDLHLQDSAKCDTACEDTIERESGNRLSAALVRRAAQLRTAGASAILVDITHNGGGSDWVEPLPKVLSSVPLREPRLGFLKQEHWTSQLKEHLNDVETDLKKGASPKDVLEDAATRLRSAIARSQEGCDRSGVWTDGQLKCTLLVSDVLFVSGVLNYAPPGAFASLESRTTLFHPEFYNYSESSDRLPLYVVVDGDTWSAAEYFAAILQDNGAATILGDVTGGAGCGYTNGGIPSTLKNSRAVVKMPDCVRLRKDGSNENFGVVPDVWIPWSVHDNSYTSAQKLLHSLLTVFTRKSKEVDHEAH